MSNEKDLALALLQVKRNYETLAGLHKESQNTLAELERKRAHDQEVQERLRADLSESVLKAAAAALAAEDLERVSAENQALREQLRAGQEDNDTLRRTRGEGYAKLGELRDRLTEADGFKRVANNRIDMLEGQLREAGHQLTESETVCGGQRETLGALRAASLHERKRLSEQAAQLKSLARQLQEAQDVAKRSRGEVLACEAGARRARDAQSKTARGAEKLLAREAAAALALQAAKYEHRTLEVDLRESRAKQVKLLDQVAGGTRDSEALSQAQQRCEALEARLRGVEMERDAAHEAAREQAATLGARDADIVRLQREVGSLKRSAADAARALQEHGSQAARAASLAQSAALDRQAEEHQFERSEGEDAYAKLVLLEGDYDLLGQRLKEADSARHKAEFEQLRLTGELDALQLVLADLEQPGAPSLYEALQERDELLQQQATLRKEREVLTKQLADARTHLRGAASLKQDLRSAEETLMATVRDRNSLRQEVARVQEQLVQLQLKPAKPSAELLAQWAVDIGSAVRSVLGAEDGDEIMEVLEGAALAQAALAHE